MDGAVSTRFIPLYVKLCGFFYRNYHYRDLSRRITGATEGDFDKVTVIYAWTVKHIREHPAGFTVVDDHIWDIVVRGYGLNDQMADVFVTLASYAGYEAFWRKLRVGVSAKVIILSFVRIGNKWYVFDIRGRKSFLQGDALNARSSYGPTYGEYIETMDGSEFASRIRRPDKQKIFPRLVYEIRKVFGREPGEVEK
ncbi:MAG: transglutaminase-like domain-containing protein [Omnitrophica bacterium]|nr:transglutaminase-like domain-containing protein [Candidatus Omnitrophota bacterium]